ncbi:MAG TPA: hypothetical protein VG871_18155 [Vicinamibacterales bacterium]|nr:hypothetical protein [Vicinamibacterales bacterium]
MTKTMYGVVAAVAFCSVSLAAQWPKIPDPSVPRTADGKINYDAPTPRTPDGHPDLSGIWMHANSGPPNAGRGRGGRGAAAGRGAAPANGALNATAQSGVERETRAIVDGAGGGGRQGGNRGGVSLEPATAPFPYDPKGPPVATFFEAGANMEGGLPYTPWAKELKDKRMALKDKDNPDANCMPMGFLQFHQQPQPRKIMYVDKPNPKMLLIEWEANYGLWHIYMDGRKLPAQGDPNPFWYGYSVGHWEGDDLVVETNNLRGAEDSANDGWLDVNGSPYSEQAVFTHRIRRPTYGHLQIDVTVNDPKSYTHPWTVRVDQRIAPDQEMIEFICNENQQFRRRIKVDEGNEK